MCHHELLSIKFIIYIKYLKKKNTLWEVGKLISDFVCFLLLKYVGLANGPFFGYHYFYSEEFLVL